MKRSHPTSDYRGAALRRWCVGLCLLLLPALALGQHVNECDEAGEEPDIIVGDLYETRTWGNEGGITAFSVGTTSCNVGTCWAEWEASTNKHPVIGQNMYRLKDGRFEQVGQSWLKHGYFALTQDFCGSCEDAGIQNGDHLGVNCSDPYSSNLNGDQVRLGPRSEVNASTGVFAYPFSTQGSTGNSIYKRLQVHDVDLEPALNPGALYFVEGQYVTQDDPAAGNPRSNISYRLIDVTGSGDDFDISLLGSTMQKSLAVDAWKAFDPTVRESTITVPADGAFALFSRATDLGGGQWHYEFAVHNLTSHRSGGSFRVPVPPGANISAIGFHDVDYHSGEPYSGTDWPGQVVVDGLGTAVFWNTDAFVANPDANALRWGTLYNFRFDADVPPVFGEATLGLFRTGIPASVTGGAMVPSSCDNNGVCEGGESCSDCADCLTSTNGFCGDDLCEPGIGEDCLSCAGDCNGDQQGAGQFCCGDGDGFNPVGCNDSRCTENAFDCGSALVEYCCGDAICDSPEDMCQCSFDCGLPSANEQACDNSVDDDCDGATDCSDLDCCTDVACVTGTDADLDGVADCDCDDNNDQVWSTPGEATGLALSPDPVDGTDLDWQPPSPLGGTSVNYEVLRSPDDDFETGTACLAGPNPTLPSVSDAALPGLGGIYYYLIRALNQCPIPAGSLGTDSQGTERNGQACP